MRKGHKVWACDGRGEARDIVCCCGKAKAEHCYCGKVHGNGMRCWWTRLKEAEDAKDRACGLTPFGGGR